uniref:Immunoglobulin superfamily member 10 n=1 Tax=Gopherus evgoodei TaxID=1825980 RepID=A0A8C4W4V0_9SAUR
PLYPECEHSGPWTVPVYCCQPAWLRSAPRHFVCGGISTEDPRGKQASVQPDGTLIIKEVTVYDRGLYTCMASNPAGADTLTVKLQVGISEEGDYTCYAQNTLGKDEMKVHITVVTASPRIKQNYRTYAKVKAGDNAVFDCEAVGEPKPKIFWLLPSSDMISASTDRYLLHVNGSLSVSKVKLLDAGEYVCVARNPGGDDTKLYKLDVVSKPPLINGLYTNKTVIKATAIRHSKKQIDCMSEGTPSLQIMWIMPDNIFLTAPYYGSRITVHKNGTLEIRNVRPSDTADFICVVRNDGGESILGTVPTPVQNLSICWD